MSFMSIISSMLCLCEFCLCGKFRTHGSFLTRECIPSRSGAVEGRRGAFRSFWSWLEMTVIPPSDKIAHRLHSCYRTTICEAWESEKKSIFTYFTLPYLLHVNIHCIFQGTQNIIIGVQFTNHAIYYLLG